MLTGFEVIVLVFIRDWYTVNASRMSGAARRYMKGMADTCQSALDASKDEGGDDE